MIILQNELLSASISPNGAELQSLISKETGIEYMWCGDAAYWGKFSPVLFPIVGTLKDDTYYYEGQAYKLPRHGFAREKIFAVTQISETEAVFTIESDEATLAVYPFDFVFKLRYKLNGTSLSCTYEVENPGTKDLLFSVGAHPAFAVPNLKDSEYEDYFLQFNNPEILKRYKLEAGLIGTQTEIIVTENGRLPLSAGLFYEDAIVLKNLESTCTTIGCYKHSHGLHFHFNNFPFFGIWAAKNAPFVCLEPWCGIADSTEHNQQLEDKEGIITLSPNTSWERSWEVECF
jgi:galactose mutarotase-like enzyme